MSPSVLTTASRVGNLAKHQTLKQIKMRRGASPVDASTFDALLERHGSGHSEVFVHAGLSDIKSAFRTNPYKFLLQRLDEQFESVLVPGFTDYFKTSGVYHKEFSRPKHGTFVSLFLDDANYRTNDAIKSFLVRGPYRFDDCVHDDSYHEDGCFAALVEDDTLFLNVGTPWITCSHFHYIEAAYDVPYVTEATYEGVRYTTATEYEHVEQTCGTYRSKFYSWNKPKIARYLEREGILHRYDLNGLQVRFFTVGDTYRALGDRLEDNEYYMVSL